MSSSGINTINSGPLIIRTYLDNSNNNSYVLGNFDYPISSNYILITSTNGLIAPSNNINISSLSVSSFNAQYAYISSLSSYTFFSNSANISTISSNLLNMDNGIITDVNTIFFSSVIGLPLTTLGSNLYFNGLQVLTGVSPSSISSLYWNEAPDGVIFNNNIGTPGNNHYLVGIGKSHSTINATLDVEYSGITEGNILNLNATDINNDSISFNFGFISSNGTLIPVQSYINSDSTIFSWYLWDTKADPLNPLNTLQLKCDSIDGVICGSTLINITSSYVGIGIENPQFTLDVNGFAHISTSGGVLLFEPDGTNGNIIRYGGGGPNANNLLFVGAGNFEKMRINPLGYVGINTNDPQATLDVNGEIRTTSYLSSLVINNLSSISTNGNNLRIQGEVYLTGGTDGATSLNLFNNKAEFKTNLTYDGCYLELDNTGPYFRISNQGYTQLYAQIGSTTNIFNGTVTITSSLTVSSINTTSVINQLRVAAGTNDSFIGQMSKFYRTTSSNFSTIDYMVGSDSTATYGTSYIDTRYVYDSSGNFTPIWAISLSTNNGLPHGAETGDVLFYNNVFSDKNIRASVTTTDGRSGLLVNSGGDVPASVCTIIGAYSEGSFSGANVGSIQVMAGGGASPYTLALNPRGGDVSIGSTISNCDILSNILYVNGNVGIGTTSPNYTLDVSGNIYASGNITAGSDRRFKDSITTISNALSTVKEMRGTSYMLLADNSKQIGFIAQELEQVLPEVVFTDTTPEQYKSVAYGNIVAVLVEAVKELSAKVDMLSDKINNM
jgi:hypothetical protein